MTQPHGTPINLQRQFPKTRADAERISNLVKQQAQLAGCTCRELKIEFVEPILGKPFVQVGHAIFCPMSTDR